jgi:hypothetical protein
VGGQRAQQFNEFASFRRRKPGGRFIKQDQARRAGGACVSSCRCWPWEIGDQAAQQVLEPCMDGDFARRRKRRIIGSRAQKAEAASVQPRTPR